MYVIFCISKMSSDRESSNTSTSEVDSESNFSSSNEDIGTISNQFLPYKCEPLAGDAANVNFISEESQSENIDPDFIPPDVLASRNEGEIPLTDWCKCGHCKTTNLEGAMEFRCCHEVGAAIGKLCFDASIKKIKCITQHEDYMAHTNESVLDDVAPLLCDKSGRAYRSGSGQSRNEFLRAVAYRWLVQWLCGYKGWDNRRPLASCIYHNVRSRYQTTDKVGYVAASERE